MAINMAYEVEEESSFFSCIKAEQSILACGTGNKTTTTRKKNQKQKAKQQKQFMSLLQVPFPLVVALQKEQAR